MKLASSSYYYHPLTDLQERDRSDAELRDHIEWLQGEFPGYGYRRLGRRLRREGIVVKTRRSAGCRGNTSYSHPLAEFQDLNHRFQSWAQGLSQSASGNDPDRNQSGLGGRHHLLPPLEGIYLSGGHPGSLLP